MARPVELDMTSQLSPSLRKIDHMNIQEEIDTRRRTCRYIDEACRLLQLPKIAAATAMVLFHRFDAKHNALFRRSDQHDRFEVAMAAVLLAAKIEESPKFVDHVVAVCHDLQNHRGGVQQAGQLFLGRSSSRCSTRAEKEQADDEALIKKKLKERVLLLERVLLHTIGFELSIDHPYKFIMEQIRRLVDNERIELLTSGTTSDNKAMEVGKWPTARIREALMDEMKKWYARREGCTFELALFHRS
jgi:Cyclin, N-terminal domain